MSIGPSILVLNAGSSSLKFALFDAGAELIQTVWGEIETLDAIPFMHARDESDASLTERRWLTDEPKDFDSVLTTLLKFIDDQLRGAKLIAVGHRVVHGGAEHVAPEIVTKDLLAKLEALTPLDPLHLPHNIAPIRAIAAARPGLPQVACFDTAFHHTMPAEASHFALPRALTAAGVRRYGFHGLSYEFIVRRLRATAPALARGKVIAAHLGAGASLCAMQNGVSIATTMGFSVLDGLVMATRCGELDPGVILYLLRQGKSVAEIEDIALSPVRLARRLRDQRRHARADREQRPPRARGVDLFTYRAAIEIGEFGRSASAVSTASCSLPGIGERAPSIRAEICARLGWLGLRLDLSANVGNAKRIGAPDSQIDVRVIATDEEAMIARHTKNWRSPTEGRNCVDSRALARRREGGSA